MSCKRKSNEKDKRESKEGELEKGEKEREMIIKIDERERVASEMRENVKRYRRQMRVKVRDKR